VIAPLALLGIAGADAAEPLRRHALLVGANDGGADRATLRYAHRDAESMSDVLTTLGGVAIADRTVLYDPSPAELDRAIGELAAEVASESGRTEVLFYYSGHSDEEGLLLGDERIPYRALRDSLERIPADVRLAILDSCASGALIRAKGGSPVPGFMVDQSNTVGGFAYITSSSEDEVAQEGDRIGGSYFTHFLASGLRGAADYDANGRVTLDEVYSFAHTETLERTARTQYGPQHAARDTQLSGTGDLVLTDLGLTSSTLVLDMDIEGRTLVRDDDGHLVAELDKQIGVEIQLGLSAGTYDLTVVEPDDARYAVASIDVENGTSSLLTADDLVWYDAEWTVGRGSAKSPDAPLAIVEGHRPDDHGTRPVALTLVAVDGSRDVTDNVAISMIGATSHAIDGAAMSLAFYGVDTSTDGVLMSLGATWTREIQGAQLSLGGNLAERGEGVQLSLGGNAISKGGFDGMQGVVGVNLAAGSGIRGTQLAAGVNVATEIHGLQASMVNVANRVDGMQLGLVNVGGHVHGVQLGLINVADDVDGVPIGLLSIEKHGRHDILASASSTDLFNLEFKLGSDAFYTGLAVGGTPGQQLYGQLGFGGHVPLVPKVWLDIDAGWASYGALDGPDGPFETQPEGIARARGTVGFQVAKEFAPFVGGAVNFRIPIEGSQQVVDPLLDLGEDSSTSVSVFPGLFAGVQF
jgi:hypothetical protein